MALAEHMGGGKPTAVIIDIAGVGIIGSVWLGYLSEAATIIATTIVSAHYIAEFYESKLGRLIGHSIRRMFRRD